MKFCITLISVVKQMESYISGLVDSYHAKHNAGGIAIAMRPEL